MSTTINNYGNSMIDLYEKAENSSSSKLEGNLNKDYSKASDEELMDVCNQFESYFLEQVFKSMEKMVPKSADEDSSISKTVDYFKDDMIQKIAGDSTKNQGLGLAKTLYESMKRQYDV